MNQNEAITEAVKSKYAAIAREERSCCGTDCCDVSTGYSANELESLPAGANLSLGCGNPTSSAQLKPGETVVDLGSGAGIDCFLAAQRVGPTGHVIGIDMTEEMINKARANAAANRISNVTFRLGQIEAMPIADSTADVVISNCVINLAPDKKAVFDEIYRVLKPGGRFIVSDIVAKGEIPEVDRRDMEQWAGCTVGALEKQEYLAIVEAAGFTSLNVRAEVDYDYKKSEQYSLASITLEARKP